jgi:hypothetical protein
MRADCKGSLYEIGGMIPVSRRMNGISETNEQEGSREKNWDDQSDFVKYYHNHFMLDKRVNRMIKTFIQQHLVIADPSVKFRTWARQAMAIEPFVAEIQGRGGKVVFLRLPSTGKHWELDQQCYPKDRYWDQFSARTSAETIHFMNCLTLSGYNCPEGSHLDSKDALTFTRDLGRESRKKGILSRCGYHQRTQYE